MPDRGAAAAAVHGKVNLAEMPSRALRSGLVHVLVDTPAGSRNKYKYDPALKVFRLSRTLPQGAVFPCDFGSIPSTCAEDGDALDVLVLQEAAPTFPGCLLTVRLIGVLRAQQREAGKLIRNDRLVSVVETPVNPARCKELRALDPEVLRSIEHFFESYNRFQGRPFRILRRGGAQRAEELLRRAERCYRQKTGQ
jgi:inorganic pyrophosphatase